MIFPKSKENDVLGVASKRIRKIPQKEARKASKLIDLRNQIDTLRSREKDGSEDGPLAEPSDRVLHDRDAQPQDDRHFETGFDESGGSTSRHESTASELEHAEKEVVQARQYAGEELVHQLRSEIDFLRQQLDRKDRQLEVKDDLLENFQVLLKSEQDKVLLLERNRKTRTWWQRLTGRNPD